MVDWQLDLMILEVFSNLNDSMILYQAQAEYNSSELNFVMIIHETVRKKQLSDVFGTAHCVSKWMSDEVVPSHEIQRVVRERRTVLSIDRKAVSLYP